MSAVAGEAAASDTLRRWYAAWNAHDPNAILALTTEDIRYEDPIRSEPVMHGHAAIELPARSVPLVARPAP